MSEAVRRRAAGHTDRTHLQGVIPGQRALARLGLRDREPELPDEPVEDLARIAVDDTATDDHERPPAGGDRVGGPLERGPVRAGTGHMADVRLEESAGNVECLGLHVLWQGQGDRSGLRG